MNGDQTIGQIMQWSLPWAPQGWHLCDGSTLTIQQNQALYTILGTTYGGDGKTTFGLPDFRGRIPVGMGLDTNSGITYAWGAKGGLDKVTLDLTNLPAHTHGTTLTPQNLKFSGALNVAKTSGAYPMPVPAPNTPTYLAGAFSNGSDGSGNPLVVSNFIPSQDNNMVTLTGAVNVTTTPSVLSPTIGTAGGGTAHTNMQPYLVINYIIAVQGYYPQRP